ncbi:MAG: pyridoxamine 5'-phosphate oxidase family protein [Pseudomonadales bacterium]|nr:pyridoxamine 5'-phosphate oxidase family protein [Pseudomonadales bacterium]MBO6597812.1 pyridoxamine 5'-phosphate oxidase family protein [Pseudomonadales bacterium]MBO6824050.1 pyridoxamine 5'-phosphate oxidase family protein [Pseudomonadales bacterium]
MNKIESIEALEALYGPAVPGSLTKVQSVLTPQYRRWIDQAKFTILTTVGPEGTDASPRGDIDSVVRIADDQTLWLPDWRGNNRMDSLRNIVRDGRVSLLFMVPGSNNVIRVNGQAILSVDQAVTAAFEHNGKHPRSVIVVSVAEVYFQCAKALMRSKLWSGEDQSDKVPTAGDFLKEVETGFDAKSYDEGYAEYAKDKMW